MRHCLLEQCPAEAVPLHVVTPEALAEWQQAQAPQVRRWLETQRFTGKSGAHAGLPATNGELAGWLVVMDPAMSTWALGAMAQQLPEGDYRLVTPVDRETRRRLALGWALGAYQFTRYRSAKRAPARLAVEDTGLEPVMREALAVFHVRDLINTPAQDMMPEDLAAEAESLARDHGGVFRQWVGDELLEADFPAVHAVGRASTHPPRLLELSWGDPGHPGVTLVGKGVCFDSGGLDIKPASGMRLMKKDMGGAAHVLGLAGLVMATGLAVHLRVLVPAVENAISGNAFRPGDVLATRAGLTVEVDNTDAEGRLILCDALAEAVRASPEVILDFATLTGAARVALGTELPALFSNDDALASGLLEAAARVDDPVWRMPLHAEYREMLDSRIADLVNSPNSGLGGAITAALFLRAFVPDGRAWAHFDVMAWNNRNRPGRPEGGEAMGLRAAWGYLAARYG